MVSIRDFCYDAASFGSNHESELRWVGVFMWIVGLLGNILNIVVFGHKSMNSPVNKVLWWLSISDLLELVSIASYAWGCEWCFVLKVLNNHCRQSYLGAKTMSASFFLLQTFHTITVGLNIALAFWRYLAVIYPLHSKFQCDHRSVKLTVAGLYVLSLILCLPILLVYGVQKVGE